MALLNNVYKNSAIRLLTALFCLVCASSLCAQESDETVSAYPEDMSYAFGLIKEPLPANFNPYSGPKMMGRTMGGLAPIIEKERPDIFQKLGKLRAPLKEVYADVTKQSKPVS